MAGMRIGFCIGSEALISCLNNAKYSFNSYTMDTTALAAGVAAVKDREYFDGTCRKIIETREWTKKELKKLGFSFEDSMANFIFASHESLSRAGENYFPGRFREHHILCPGIFPGEKRTGNHLRITIGTQKEMEVLTEFLRNYLNEQKI